MRHAILLVALVACRPMKPPGKLRTDQGTTAPRRWCDPTQGLPADPALGIDRPLQFGVGSIVHERDSTSETFIAARAFGDLLRLPERKVSVSVIDHPTDADYSVMGMIRGDVRYGRETQMGGLGYAGLVGGILGYVLGGTFTGTGLILSAASESSIGDTFLTVGLLTTAVGIAGNVIVATRPSNHYTWDQTAHLTLRRGTVVIGEFEVRDVFDRVQWDAMPSLRTSSTAALWQAASREVESCIAADLARLLSDQPTAATEAP